MSDTVIRVENLGKQYRIGAVADRQSNSKYSSGYRTLRDDLVGLSQRLRRGNGSRNPSGAPGIEIIWALRNVSFEVKRGQVLGIIGRNGAGKSTLLKILSRVTEPTEGFAEIHGRIGALLEVGTGFHPELTGRENVFLNGAILGMGRKEIERKFDEIVDFAEVARFIDTPVKRYSSGMYLRLAFAVAAHLEPEILVVDEVLAVGDAEFQRKCMGKMNDVALEGRTVLFVSHNMSAILRLTEQAIVLERGKLVFQAPTAQAVDYYMSAGLAETGEHIWQPDEIPASAAPFRPLALRVRDSSGRTVDSFRSTEPMRVEFDYVLDAPLTGLRAGIYLLTSMGEFIFVSYDTDDERRFNQFTARPAGRYRSTCTIPANLLNEGGYMVGVNASTYRIKRYFESERALMFSIDGIGAPGKQWPEKRMGPIRPALEWQIETL